MELLETYPNDGTRARRPKADGAELREIYDDEGLHNGLLRTPLQETDAEHCTYAAAAAQRFWRGDAEKIEAEEFGPTFVLLA